MASYSYLTLLFISYIFFSPSLAQTKLPLKAVNLGNWLVTEGWMKPSRFNDIPQNNLLDGTQVQFKSTKLQKYICAENGGGTIVVANRSSASDWETFRLWRINETHFNFRVSSKQFVGLKDYTNRIVAGSDTAGFPQTFQIVFSTERNENNKNSKVKIKASNGQFIQVQSDTLLTADYSGSGWEDSNPSVFIMTIVRTLQGEYQITNGYGPDKAPQVMRDHWNTYITEQDFQFMSSNGLNAVRIPVGWWIAKDPNPPKPFVGGSLQALDNAFKWAGAKNVQQNIDYIYNTRSSDLAKVTTSNGPLSFVGEWTGEFANNGASKQDYQRFAKAQLDVYGRATFGWAYWASKCEQNHWSLKWMIENNYIKL
ncbi:hypothetical protein HS088_TW03G00147 [Tripterygium wilfordii]|uniref:DUF7910 domain-containing protein n=1 Tax=Tripterygium wilfordii TaxID=458696 RepID=A0A7J7DU47_TRIWF|nr:hypothetical protein HS088_TW03G00147 [Tripterygium wilfordii]